MGAPGVRIRRRPEGRVIPADLLPLGRLEQWIDRFRSRFLHADGWHECVAPDGEVVRAEMPSTTPYHLLTAYQALRTLG